VSEGEYRTETGREKAWAELRGRDPAAVELSAGAVYDREAGTYTLGVFGDDCIADPAGEKVSYRAHPCRTPEYLLDLAVPVYLANARPIPPSGELVKEFEGGDFFLKGAHTLPLEELALMYGNDREWFLRAGGDALGGSPAGFGDASVEMYVFPRVSMTFVLWLGDEEFPARISLLYDSNANMHLPLDVLWAVALVACERLLKYPRKP